MNAEISTAWGHRTDMILQHSHEGLSREQNRKNVAERYYRVIEYLENDSDIKNWKL